MTSSIPTRRTRAAGLTLLAITLGLPWAVHAQQTRSVRGTVIDAATREPVPGVLVRATGAAARGMTDAEGAFRLDGVPAGTQTFVFQRIGYGVSQVELDPPPGERVVISIDPVPVPVAGLDAEARSFRTRMDSIMHLMDRNAYGRYWSSAYTNMPRVAGIEEMREVHHLDDPELAMRVLQVQPAFDHDCGILDGPGIVGPRVHRRRMVLGMRGGTPTPHGTIVYIDGEEYGYQGQGCDRMRAMDTSSICRMELFHVPDPRLPDYRLRVWTCAFLARLAASEEPVPEMLAPALLWPDFMGPGGE